MVSFRAGFTRVHIAALREKGQIEAIGHIVSCLTPGIACGGVILPFGELRSGMEMGPQFN
jgi:hypothetical protein